MGFFEANRTQSTSFDSLGDTKRHTKISRGKSGASFRDITQNVRSTGKFKTAQFYEQTYWFWLATGMEANTRVARLVEYSTVEISKGLEIIFQK